MDCGTESFVVELFSRSVMCNSLWPHGLQHPRSPCPTPSLRACPNSCPLSRWCHPTISFSVVQVSSCLKSFLASGSFLMSQLFTSGSQSFGASASASVLPMNIQNWFPLGLTGLIFLQSRVWVYIILCVQEMETCELVFPTPTPLQTFLVSLSFTLLCFADTGFTFNSANWRSVIIGLSHDG